MNSTIGKISLLAVFACWPGWALAAEGEPAEGSWFALIFYAINFLVFLWIVRVYGWPRISEFFRSRSRTIRDNRGRAERAYQEAQELAQRAAQQLRQLEADERTMTTELDQETTYQVRQINQAAREAVGRIRHDTETTIVAVRDGAQRRLRQTMADAAGRIAGQLVRANFEQSDQKRLLQDFVETMAEESRS